MAKPFFFFELLFMYAKESDWRLCSNAAKDQLIRVHGAKISSKEYTNQTVLFGVANFGSFLIIPLIDTP